jgi:type IV pilus biogenesis protein CpaD/CtpE
VRNRAFTLVVVLACAAGMSAWAAAQQSRPPTDQTILEDILTRYRIDLQNSRASIISRDVTLTAEQGERFWPVFENYQKEQSAIMDAQMSGIQTFITATENMTDGAALAFMQAHLDRDTAMAELRRRWLREFQFVLPTKLAVRVMQVDRRISLTQQTQFTTQIPLVQ